HYRIGTGIFCIIILSGGYITRPYRGSLGCCAQSRLRHRRIGGGFGIVMPNHVYGIVVMVGDLGLSYWHVDPGIIVL
ncbi:MAG: hypothetical protein M1552_06465, partial [Firmicutes bacterium]|nr:hypothetical protein [Bacillota bacterium]